MGAAVSDREELLFRLALKNDFLRYSPLCLKVKPKEGGLVPFRPNFCQEYVHRVAEHQMKTLGRVRIIVLKGRQQGISTYIEGRLYHKSTHGIGLKTAIITHEDKATQNLFEMVERYHEHCPPEFRPATSRDNAKELKFSALDTQYTVATAGAKGTGRGQTIHLFHGSEVAYWPNAASHFSGIMEGIPNANGTEIWLESTASGPGDIFHLTWQSATDVGAEPSPDSNEYIRIFIPWFWQEEYREDLKEGFEETMTDEEREYMLTYRLDYEQMQWRRTKILKFGGDIERFRRDYPATPDEAFTNATHNTMIPTTLVVRARRPKQGLEAYGARILGVDVAREGDDRSALAFRHGRIVPWVKPYVNKDNMELTGLVVKAVREYAIDRIFCDGVGNGSGVIDRLRELGFGHMLTPIKGNAKPLDPVLYYNKRAECWGRMKEWFDDEPVMIPDDTNLQADLCGLTKKHDSTERLVLEKKSEAKKRGIKSPDLGDALAFTFAYPVSLSSHGSFEPDELEA